MSLKLRLHVVAIRTDLVGGVCTEVEVDVNLAGEGERCAFCRGDVDGEASYPTESCAWQEWTSFIFNPSSRSASSPVLGHGSTTSTSIMSVVCCVSI